MSCDRELLDLYVAGALEPDQVTALERHLSNCVACRTEERETKKLLAQVSARRERDPGDAFFTDMARAIRKDCAEVDAKPRGLGAWLSAWWRPLSVGGLVATAALAVLLVLAHRPHGTTTTVAMPHAKAPAPVARHAPVKLPSVDIEDLEDSQLDSVLAHLDDDDQANTTDDDDADVLGDDAALHDTIDDLDDEDLDRVYAALGKGV